MEWGKSVEIKSKLGWQKRELLRNRDCLGEGKVGIKIVMRITF